MAGIDNILQISRQALLANKRALEVISHNIANVNTEGYSRQQVIMGPTTPLDVQPGPIGTGVEIKEIERIYDRFLGIQIIGEKQKLGKWEELNKVYALIENFFNETDDTTGGLTQLLSEFWNAWYDLANNPTGQSERVNVKIKAEALADALNQKISNLKQIQYDLDSSIKSGIEEVNLLTQQIASLNEKIVQIESGGGEALDYRDQRQSLIEELGEWLNITAVENSEGKMTIFTKGGLTLVDHIDSWNLTVKKDSSGFYAIQWVDSSGNENDITSSITAGKLGAWLEMRDTNIPELLDQVNELAAGLIKEVNKTHSQGIGLSAFTTLTSDYAVADPATALATVDSNLPFYGEITTGEFQIWVYDDTGAVVDSKTITINATTTLNDLQASLNAVDGISAVINADNTLTITAEGNNSFGFANDTSNVLMALGINTFFSGQDASDIRLNSVVETDPSMIATGLIDPNTGDYASGDNRNASLIAALQDKLTMADGSATFAEFYAQLVGYVGSKTEEASRNWETEEAFFTQLINNRESISGVSLDEEMANMVLFQQAYEAAAKLVNLADEMFQTLLQML
jgi:flagellar hook-associated protein 1 FlgK